MDSVKHDELVQRLAAPDKHAYWPAVALRHDAADAITQLRAERDALRHALMELRVRYHAAGRRPEECYEMSLIDAALAAREGK